MNDNLKHRCLFAEGCGLRRRRAAAQARADLQQEHFDKQLETAALRAQILEAKLKEAHHVTAAAEAKAKARRSGDSQRPAAPRLGTPRSSSAPWRRGAPAPPCTAFRRRLIAREPPCADRRAGGAQGTGRRCEERRACGRAQICEVECAGHCKREAELAQQLANYGSKFEQFQSTLTQSNDVRGRRRPPQRRGVDCHCHCLRGWSAL